MNSPYEYIEGKGEEVCYAQCLNACGNVIGCLKAWVPCVGCFLCCFPNPFQVVSQGRKGLVMRFKKYVKTVEPGLVYINPMTESLEEVDVRIKVIDLDRQVILTKDNINVSVDACVYYTITEAPYATFRLESIRNCVAQMTYAILKNTAGVFTFQEMLEKRNDIANDIEKQIEPLIKGWGIKVNEIYFKDFLISDELYNYLNSASRARRTADSSILSARADVEIAKMLSYRSKLLDSNTAMQIRYLDTLKQLSTKESCKVIYTPGHH